MEELKTKDRTDGQRTGGRVDEKIQWAPVTVGSFSWKKDDRYVT